MGARTRRYPKALGARSLRALRRSLSRAGLRTTRRRRFALGQIRARGNILYLAYRGRLATPCQQLRVVTIDQEVLGADARPSIGSVEVSPFDNVCDTSGLCVSDTRKPMSEADLYRLMSIMGLAGWGDACRDKVGGTRRGRKAGRYGPVNPGPLDDVIANTFRSGSYIGVTTSKPTTLYRVYSGNKELSSYWTRTKPSGPVQSIIDNALDPAWGNQATNWVKVRVPAGTSFYEGAAASQGGLVGGNQVFISRVDPSWVVGRGGF